MSDLKDYDWSREPSEDNDHEVIFLQPVSGDRTWCCDSIDPDVGIDTAYVRADKLSEVLALLDLWIAHHEDRDNSEAPYHASFATQCNYGWRYPDEVD